MKLSWLRSRSGKLLGVTLLRSHVHITSLREATEKAERYCDCCMVFAPSIVFCTTDNVYLCESCLVNHKSVLGIKCNYISTAVARELFRQLESMCQ